ncbi:hypothetical protein AYO44_14490 [Planctomycetaceae bacterium SCGC AG-212-F19]|nr:hypothetical protein AYO44_14490 [Planctomycetaceae bacterium SCGC AG-212-F19]
MNVREVRLKDADDWFLWGAEVGHHAIWWWGVSMFGLGCVGAVLVAGLESAVGIKFRNIPEWVGGLLWMGSCICIGLLRARRRAAQLRETRLVFTDERLEYHRGGRPVLAVPWAEVRGAELRTSDDEDVMSTLAIDTVPEKITLTGDEWEFKRIIFWLAEKIPDRVPWKNPGDAYLLIQIALLVENFQEWLKPFLRKNPPRPIKVEARFLRKMEQLRAALAPGAPPADRDQTRFEICDKGTDVELWFGTLPPS